MQRSFAISQAASPPDLDERGRVAAAPPVVETSNQRNENQIAAQQTRAAHVRLARKNSGNGESYPIFGE